MIKSLEEALKRVGVFEYGMVDSNDVEFSLDVRKYCEDNVCRLYGATWACPPALGTVDECAARVRGFEKTLIFSAKYEVDDSFDFEGYSRGMAAFKNVADAVDEIFRAHPQIKNHMVLGNEGCGMCEECAYPDSPCRFPDKARGSIEGYGIWVNRLAEQAGINYTNGVNTITYFGAVLFNEIKCDSQSCSHGDSQDCSAKSQ